MIWLYCILFYMPSFFLHSKFPLLFLAKLCSCLADHPFASIFLHGDKDPEPVKCFHKHEGENERILEKVEGVCVALESSQCCSGGVVTSGEVDVASTDKQHDETER
jgi:hypothetical protein